MNFCTFLKYLLISSNICNTVSDELKGSPPLSLSFFSLKRVFFFLSVSQIVIVCLPSFCSVLFPKALS